MKRIVLSDSSLNSYGYRVLTEGIHLESFLKNPVMLYMHYHGCVIGSWKDVRVEDGKLTAEPVFDKVDNLSKEVAARYEAGSLRATSIGFRVLATSSKEEHLLPGQTRETVTEAELREVSIVDIPSNSNAVRLVDDSSVELAAGRANEVVPELKKKEEVKMNFNKKWMTVLSFLGVKEDQAEQTELSAAHIESLNTEMGRLQKEHNDLVDEKKKVDEQLSAKDGEIAKLNNSVSELNKEVSTLKNDVKTKDDEIAKLKGQVENLQKKPAQDENLSPKGEPAAEEREELSAKIENADASDIAGLCDIWKEEGLI